MSRKPKPKPEKPRIRVPASESPYCYFRHGEKGTLPEVKCSQQKAVEPNPMILTPAQIEAPQQRIRDAMKNIAAGKPVVVTTDHDNQTIEHRSAPPLGASGNQVEGAELKPPIIGEETLADARNTPAKDAIDRALAQSSRPEPRHHIQTRDEDGKATSHAKEATLAERKAATTEALRRDVEEERFFKAMEGFGVTQFLQAFGVVVGAGLGGGTLYVLYAAISHGPLVLP